MSAVPARIGIMAARQGGFSAVQVPPPLELRPPDPVIIYTDGAQMLITESGNSVDTSVARVYRARSVAGGHTCDSVSFPISYASSGGPFGEPYVQAAPQLDGTFASDICKGNLAELAFIYGSLFPSIPANSTVRRQWTVEMFYRMNSDLTVLWKVGSAGGQALRVGFGDPSDLRLRVTSPFINELVGPKVTGQWRHFAYCSDVDANTTEMYDHGARIYEGAQIGALNENYPGASIDVGQIRVTAGQKLYTGSTITVPAVPFFTP